MNFYKHYLGDYARDTQGLSLTEHGAYRVLLDTCYATEKPLPEALQALYRICRAATAPERRAVDRVAEQFFPVGADGGRRNPRVEVELSNAAAYADAQSKRAQVRWHGSGNASASVRHMPEGMQAQCPDDASHSQTPKPEKARSKAKAHAPKTPLPPDFGVSPRVEAWAASKGFGALDIHLEVFRSKALAKGYTYADWDEGFMGAIREDWAGLRTGGNGTRPRNPNRQESLEERNLRVAEAWSPPEDA